MEKFKTFKTSEGVRGPRLIWNIWGHRPEEEQDASAIPFQNSQSETLFYFYKGHSPLGVDLNSSLLLPEHMWTCCELCWDNKIAISLLTKLPAAEIWPEFREWKVGFLRFTQTWKRCTKRHTIMANLQSGTKCGVGSQRTFSHFFGS